MSTSPLPSYHVSTPSGSFRRPAQDEPQTPASPVGVFARSPQLATRPLIAPGSGKQRAAALPKGVEEADVVYEDADCVVVLEQKRALASAGHLTLLVHPPLPSIYALSPADVPLLVRLRALARSLLARHFLASPSSAADPAQPPPGSPRESLVADGAPPPSPSETTHVFSAAQGGNQGGGGAGAGPTTAAAAAAGPSFPPRSASGSPQLQERVGFVCSPFNDPLNPASPNLTLHATLGPLDRASFWTRSGAFGPLGFYSLDDLVAEIRESTSNNRIKSGSAYSAPLFDTPSSSSPSSPTVAASTGGAPQAGERFVRPIDRAPDAVGGARFGEANGVEYGAPPAAAAAAAAAKEGAAEEAGAGGQAREAEEAAFVGNAPVDKGKGRAVEP